MEMNWFAIGLGLLITIVLVIYLVVKNNKDKDEVTTFLNKTEVDEEPREEGQRPK